MVLIAGMTGMDQGTKTATVEDETKGLRLCGRANTFLFHFDIVASSDVPTL